VAARARVHPAGTLRVDVKLILIPATVTDPFGAPYSGLPQSAFRLFEDGVEQELKYFSSDEAPISMGVVFDSSRSMEHKLDQSRAAVKRFFGTAIPGDEFLLVEFNDVPRVLCNFTSDTDQIEKTLVDIKSKNWTALLDAVYVSMRQMKRARNPRKALLILSDGGDNNSRYTEAEMKALVREGDVCIYSIALPGGGLIKRHARLLRQLSDETGGLFCQLDRMADLPDTVAKISAAIRNQYLLGYLSSNPNNNGLYRKIEVKLNQSPDLPRLRASWRTGYFAPDGW
jgi:VWFA-related protein